MRAAIPKLLMLSFALAAGLAHAGPDGTINPNYGTVQGRAVVLESPGFGSAWPGLRAMVNSTNGKTWMFGEDRSGFQNDLLLIARLDKASGQLDATFGGGDGQLLATYPAGMQAPQIDGVTLQADGKMLLFGRAFHSMNPGYEYVGFVCRINTNGTFDFGFADAGCRRIEQIASHHEECAVRDLAIDPVDSGMVMVGECRNGDNGSTNPVFVARLLANGDFDPEFTFGGVGKPTVSPGKLISINALSMQSNSRFVAVATVADVDSVDGNYDIALLQFTNEGTIDPGWHGSGAGTSRVALDRGDHNRDFGLGIAQRADGRILVSGLADGVGENDDVVLLQFETDGDLDSTFGTAGIAYGPTPLASSAGFLEDAVALRFLNGLVIDDLGRAVVLGLVPYALDMRVYRFTAIGAKDATFGPLEKGYVDIDHTPVLTGTSAAEDWPKALIVDRDRITLGSRSERNGVPGFLSVTLQASTLFADSFE